MGDLDALKAAQEARDKALENRELTLRWNYEERELRRDARVLPDAVRRRVLDAMAKQPRDEA